MSIESVRVRTNMKEYFSKMKPEDSAAIACMCIKQLADKANELAVLYQQLSKTYDIEMSITGVTLLVQVSSPILPDNPVQGLFGTSAGIKHALATMMKQGLKNLPDTKEEEKNG